MHGRRLNCVPGLAKKDDADALIRALDYRKRAADPRTAVFVLLCIMGA